MKAVEKNDQWSTLHAKRLSVGTEVVEDGLVGHPSYDAILGHGECGFDLLAARHEKKPDGLPSCR